MQQVQKLLTEAKSNRTKIYVCFITVTELYYRICRNDGRKAAQEVVSLIRSFPVEFVQSSDGLNLTAGRLKAEYPLSLADAFIAATALLHKARLVHKDPEFESLSHIIRLLSLPYKK